MADRAIISGELDTSAPPCPAFPGLLSLWTRIRPHSLA